MLGLPIRIYLETHISISSKEVSAPGRIPRPFQCGLQAPRVVEQIQLECLLNIPLSSSKFDFKLTRTLRTRKC
jgi:hypothetical protein